MGKIYKIIFTAKSTAYPEQTFTWKGEVNENTTLENLMDTLSIKYEFIKNGVYRCDSKKMFPYHLLIVNDRLIYPDQIGKYTIGEDLNVKVIPFVSGG